MKPTLKPTKLPITVDRGHDTATGIVLLHVQDGQQTRTAEVAPGWVADFDAQGRLLKLEVLNPSRHFPPEVLDLLPPEFVPA